MSTQFSRDTFVSLDNGMIVLYKVQDDSYRVDSIGNNFLDWIRESFSGEEDKSWRITYYSGSMCQMTVKNDEIITLTLLRWA
jgi:hypothetical protein